MTGAEAKPVDDLLHRVVGRLAHDLRNPLAVVVANLRFLADQLDDPDLREAAEESVLSAERLTSMIDNVAVLEPLRQGKIETKPTELALSELRAAVDRVISPLLGSRQLVWTIDTISATTDAKLVVRILTAVVEHCVRRSPPGGTIRISARDADGLVLQVSDEGAPFAPGHLPSLLDPSVPTSETAGSRFRSDDGLGLHFAGVATRALGGQAAVHERTDHDSGLVFELRIPS